MNERVSNLVNTSVQDMESGLWNYGFDEINILHEACKVAEKRGEKTKAKILRRKINKVLKEQDEKYA